MSAVSDSKTVKVSDDTFEQKVLQANVPVVVDFWAEWCGPCKMIAPALEQIADALDGRVMIAKLNVDEAQQTAAKYGIRSIPTLMMFKGGQKIAQKIGASSKPDLQRWIENEL